MQIDDEASSTHARGTPGVGTLADQAADVLRRNDLGHMTMAAPTLYPHQWSWDAAFIAIGLARMSVSRALGEMTSLLDGQWDTGMIPHIVFGDSAGYFPGPERWRSESSRHSPAHVATSGICQPPVHSLALAAIVEVARQNGAAERREAEDFLTGTFDRWLAWHRWLASVRDPDGDGLMEIYHSWESGMDNSPRWDAPYARMRTGAMRPFERRDKAHVADPDERPSDLDYSRYIWLVDQMADAGYDEAQVAASIDFRVADVFSSALLSLGSDVLADLAGEIGRRKDATELRDLATRFRDGVHASVDPVTGLARDRDVRAGEWLATQTLGGFAPLLCGGPDAVVERQRTLLLGPDWCGHPDLRYAVPPSTSPASPAFRPRGYWRGPQWPVMTWLVGWASARRGDDEVAGQLASESLRQLADGSFAEYYHPFTGAALGSHAQSWTAAVALDWLGRDL